MLDTAQKDNSRLARWAVVHTSCLLLPAGLNLPASQLQPMFLTVLLLPFIWQPGVALWFDHLPFAFFHSEVSKLKDTNTRYVSELKGEQALALTAEKEKVGCCFLNYGGNSLLLALAACCVSGREYPSRSPRIHVNFASVLLPLLISTFFTFFVVFARRCKS